MLAWLIFNQVQTPDFEFDVRSRQGLTVTAKGIPIIKGSGFQYYAPGWSKGYYSSSGADQQIRRLDGNTIEAKFSGGGADGVITYLKQDNHLIVDYDLNWGSNEAAQIELNHGLVWVPPFQNGRVSLDGAVRSLPQLPPVGSLDKRALGKPALESILSGATTTLAIKSSESVATFDGRDYDQVWAEAAPVYWQGILALPVKKGNSTKVHVEYTISTLDQVKAEPKKLSIAPSQIKNGVLPDESIPALIPNPKMSILDWKNTLTISNLWKLPAGRPKFFDLFRSELEKRFEMPEVGSLENRVSFDGGMSDFRKREGMYHIKITKDSISVYGQEAVGLRNAIYRLAQLAFIKDGKVSLPTGVIEDEPRSDFRGVHLFVGPQALEFQQKLWNNVLLPLGFNKVVLQCERTDWNALPGVHTPITMKQDDLAKLFKWYKAQDVDAIPLIQSLGHMEWLFANGNNKDLAFNPQVPYTIDPRKAGSKELIGKIWDEAIQVLKPKTIHVGLDEIDMRGFPVKNPSLVTQLWRDMVPYLGSVAKRNNVNLMLWGDEGLAPDEAVDAANGQDRENAKLRREAIPKGSIIADWHYRASESHVPFLKSLQRWKMDGLTPVASSWYKPDNIRGFGLAADVENVGTLQTTWAGYESNESNMLKNIDQFSAFVLAADYGWSGRADKFGELPYDASQVFARMYNPKQSPVVPSDAFLVGRGDIFECGRIKFSKLENASLTGISVSNMSNPELLQIGLTGTYKEVAVALTCELASATSEKIGEVIVSYQDGTKDITPLLYGLHVRALDQDGGTFFGERISGRTCLRILAKPKELRSVEFKASNRYSGLKIDGLTLIPTKGKKTPASR